MSTPIETMLLVVNSNFLVFSVFSDDMMGQSFVVQFQVAASSNILAKNNKTRTCDKDQKIEKKPKIPNHRANPIAGLKTRF
jgi:hypothetical protein